MKHLILVRGLPGSGKSTLAKQLLSELLKNDVRASHLEADMYFVSKENGYVFDATQIKDAHQWCQKTTDKFLDFGDTVIVSNTFTTKWELEPYFKIAKKHGVVPVVYLAQNQFQNIHGVPEDVLKKMRSRFEYDISSLFEEYAA